MARPIREDYPGAWHHVMGRGARRSPIFKNNDHCLEFLGRLDSTVQRFGIEVHGYSLMPNHFHLLVRSSPDIANLSRSMADFLGTYTQAVNAMQRWDGPIFRGRFKSQLIERERYLMYVLAYIHLNPVRAHLASSAREECWTSHRAYVGLEDKPQWLICAPLLKHFGGRKRLDDTVDKLQRGAMAWPEFMEMGAGMFDWREAPAEQFGDKEAEPLPERSEEVIKNTLEKVRSITGIELKEIKRQAMGPRANPGRRFAVWALWNTRKLTHRQIGKALGMTVNSVSKMLSRMGKDFPEPLQTWRKMWKKAS